MFISSRQAFVGSIIGLVLLLAAFGIGFGIQQSQNSQRLPPEHTLLLLLPRSVDFREDEFELYRSGYNWTTLFPVIRDPQDEFRWTLGEFGGKYLKTSVNFSVQHKILQYDADHMPQKTWIDDVYLGENVSSERPIVQLDWPQMDENSRAFCVKWTGRVTCICESKYSEIISTIDVNYEDANEAQASEILKSLMLLFYTRYSTSPFGQK